jgi:predicted DsbA family dithiol-disulfide isomerase
MELHPGTPQYGQALSEKFKGMDVEAMIANLRKAGAPYQIEFGPLRILANSRKALEAGEFARDHGKFHEFHAQVFHAYFTETRDIGDLAVLLDLAQAVGLDAKELKQALDDGRYLPRLEQAIEEARRYGITGTPTFIINNQYAIVGAQPLERVRAALRQIAAETQGNN